jgi:hypothetical protein
MATSRRPRPAPSATTSSACSRPAIPSRRRTAWTVRTLLARGESRVEESLAGQPDVQAEMLTVLGRVYTALSEFDRAEPCCSAHWSCAAPCSDEPGPGHGPGRAGATAPLRGDYTAGEGTPGKQCRCSSGHRPCNLQDLADAIDNLGVILSQRGDYGGGGGPVPPGARDPAPHPTQAGRAPGAQPEQPRREPGQPGRLCGGGGLPAGVAGPSALQRWAPTMPAWPPTWPTWAWSWRSWATTPRRIPCSRKRSASSGCDWAPITTRPRSPSASSATCCCRPVSWSGRNRLPESLAISDRVLDPGHRDAGIVPHQPVTGAAVARHAGRGGAHPPRGRRHPHGELGDDSDFVAISRCRLGELLYQQGRSRRRNHVRALPYRARSALPADHDMCWPCCAARSAACCAPRAAYAEAEPLLVAGHDALLARFGPDHRTPGGRRAASHAARGHRRPSLTPTDAGSCRATGAGYR